MKGISRIWDKIQEYILIISGSAVCILIFISALMRYILKKDFYGSEEIILFIAFWLYFTGSMYAAKKDTHITADMISIFTTNQKIIYLFGNIRNLVSLFINVLVTKWCIDYVLWSIQLGGRSDVFKIPHIIGQIPILISFAMWTVYTFMRTMKSIEEYKKIRKGGEVT
ncbi:MAG: TRAP transporter small permease [Tissierellia bacterium]|nr:TRAP transporter small permease [Tissierellia bacterium]